MPKNYYNITHWRRASAILSADKDMSARALSKEIKTTTVIAERIKTDFNKIQARDFAQRVKNIRPLKFSREEFFNIN